MGRRVQDLLRAHASDVFGCYGEAIEAEGPLSGEALVRVWIAPGGNVRSVDVLENHTGSTKLARCLKTAMGKWRAPSLAGRQAQQVVFPLVFKPAAEGDKETAPKAQRRHLVSVDEGRPGPMGRGGRVAARVLISESTIGATQASITHLTLQPSARLMLHLHPGIAECLYVLEGTARVRGPSGAAPRAAKPGSLIVVPRGMAHNLQASPREKLVMLQIFAPAGPEVAYVDPRNRAGTESVRRQRLALDKPELVAPGGGEAHTILGGHGRVWLLTDGKDADGMAVQRFQADAGAEVPEHNHAAADELIYLISGRAMMTLDGQELALDAGTAVHIPRGSPHTLRVLTPLEAVQVYAPPGPEQRFKAKQAD